LKNSRFVKQDGYLFHEKWGKSKDSGRWITSTKIRKLRRGNVTQDSMGEQTTN